MNVPESRRSRARTIGFRLAAILLGLLPFIAFESVCRMAGWGQLSEVEDPFVGFTAVHPLFVPDDTEQRMQVDPRRHVFFRPDNFLSEKPENEFRIFCLGGSTVQGRPYAIETSFTTWLELALGEAAPDRRWQVVNCGGISYASYRLAPILDEVLGYEPDLIILYTGHNEFLEGRTYADIKRADPAVSMMLGWSSHLRTYNLLRHSWLSATDQLPDQEPAEILPKQVDAFLDYNGGLADYHRDDAWREGAVEHYEFNLLRMVRRAQSAGVPVILVNPISNLRDCPPFKSTNDEKLSADELEQFQQLWTQAVEAKGRERSLLFQSAIDLDERYAAAHFALAKCLDEEGRYEEAKAAYLRAKEEDICPLRMIEPLYAALARVALSTDAPLVDVRKLFVDASQGGIPGDRWLLDHVHPSINGHQMIAVELLEQMAAMRLVRPEQGWEKRRKTAFLEHMESLDAAYFVHGQQRLRGLIFWTQGRADKLKPAQN